MNIVKNVFSRSSRCIISSFFFFGSSLIVTVDGSAIANPESKPKVKYAVVDMQMVIFSVDEGKNARKKLEKEIKQKEQELLKEKQELDKMNKEWKTQAPLLSESARLAKQKQFQEKFLSLRNKEIAFHKEIKSKEQRATQKIAMSVTELVQQVAKKRGYEIVFETNSSGLLYLHNPFDLTKEVIAAYQARTDKKAAKTAKKN